MAKSNFEEEVAAIAQNVIGHYTDRADAIVDKLLPHLPEDEPVIDIGAGGCLVAQQILRRTGVEVVPIDVVQYNDSHEVYLHLYDGETLPYSDRSFDTAMLIFVLHHATNERRLLAEAKRVARRQIIVIEDSPVTKAEHVAWEAFDRALNFDRHHDLALAHGTHTSSQWHKMFEESGLVVGREEGFRSPRLTGDLYPHTLFVLEQVTSLESG